VKILQISSAKNFGGGEKHFVDLSRGMKTRGHEIFVALRPTNEWQARLDFVPPENILHVSLRNSLGVLSAQKIAEFIVENNIEIVHAHAARDYIPASLACRIAKTPKFVLTRHVLFPLKSFHRFALSNLSKAIAVSSAVEANLQKIFPKDKIALVSNGIDVEIWANANREMLRKEFRFKHNISFDIFVIGTIGELKILKGHKDFILAAQIITQKFPEARFVIVGRDNSFKQTLRRDLKNLVEASGLEDRFLWLEWVEETASFFSALDVFVSASHSESFGLAILEAMASGTAIVATETEGTKELFSENTGKIVSVKNPLKLAEAAIEFLEDKHSRKIYGENARKTARGNFTLEEMIAKTEKLYYSVLSVNKNKY